MEYEIANSSDESGPDLNHRTSAESNNRKIYDSEDDKHHNKINSNCEGYDTFSIKAAPSESNVNLSPFRSKYRFFVLALFCMLMFGGYFCMDQPNALSSYINDEMTGGSSFKYNMLYSMYSYPNIILPFFSGVMIDKLGLKTSLNILFGLCIIGQSLFVLGGYIGDTTGLIFALIGRTFFGIGNESLSIVQSLFANLWFKGRELAFALAMGLSIGRLGSTSNNLLMPIIAENSSLGTALLFGLSLVFFSYWVGLALLYIENFCLKC